jgi:hypothetical protein
MVGTARRESARPGDLHLRSLSGLNSYKQIGYVRTLNRGDDLKRGATLSSNPATVNRLHDDNLTKWKAPGLQSNCGLIFALHFASGYHGHQTARHVN